jgi:hypothetical protein
MYFSSPAVVETRESEEIYPEVPRPVTVEARRVSKNPVETKFTKLGVETRFKRFGVDTKFKRFAVETRPIRDADER